MEKLSVSIKFNKKEYKRLVKEAKVDGISTAYDRYNYFFSEIGTCGVTVAFMPMFPNSKMIAVSVSYCALEDKFKKRKGKFQALNKLMCGEFIQVPLGTLLATEGAREVGRELIAMFNI